jgi:hypothetical protein
MPTNNYHRSSMIQVLSMLRQSWFQKRKKPPLDLSLDSQKAHHLSHRIEHMDMCLCDTTGDGSQCLERADFLRCWRPK